MKSRRRLPKKIVALFVFLSLIAAAYLHWGLLPGRLYPLAVKKIEATFHKKITFKKALYLPFQGINNEMHIFRRCSDMP